MLQEVVLELIILKKSTHPSTQVEKHCVTRSLAIFISSHTSYFIFHCRPAKFPREPLLWRPLSYHIPHDGRIKRFYKNKIELQVKNCQDFQHCYRKLYTPSLCEFTFYICKLVNSCEGSRKTTKLLVSFHQGKMRKTHQPSEQCYLQ